MSSLHVPSSACLHVSLPGRARDWRSPGRHSDRTVSEPLRSGLLRDIPSACDGHDAAAIPSGGAVASCASGEESRQDETHGLHKAYVAIRKEYGRRRKAEGTPRPVLAPFCVTSFNILGQALPLLDLLPTQHDERRWNGGRSRAHVAHTFASSASNDSIDSRYRCTAPQQCCIEVTASNCTTSQASAAELDLGVAWDSGQRTETYYS